MQISTARDSRRSSEHLCAVRFPALDERFASKGLGRASICLPLGAHVPLDKFIEECCPSAAIPILDMAEMKVSEISLVAVVYRSLCVNILYILYSYCRSYENVAAVGSKFFPYKSYYYVIIVSKNRFLADKILLHPSLFVPIYDILIMIGGTYSRVQLYRRISP